MARTAKRKPARIRVRPPAPALQPPEVDRATHRLRGVDYAASPHFDARPDPADVSLVVVHAISLPRGRFGTPWIDRLFAGTLECSAHPSFEALRGLRVSSHLCIFRDGTIRQYVPFDRRAWHAGQSVFDGRSGCNDFSIGIELEGCDDRRFTEAQYRQLSAVVRALMRAYPAILPSRIVGHSDVAPGRKTDPGPHFDWIRFLAELEALP